jgi:hypothetical protein
MKKKERKMLEEKIHSAAIQVLKDHKTSLTDKIEKAVKKSVKQIIKKLDKRKDVSEKKKAGKNATALPKKTFKKNGTPAVNYKKIKNSPNPPRKHSAS